MKKIVVLLIIAAAVIGGGCMPQKKGEFTIKGSISADGVPVYLVCSFNGKKDTLARGIMQDGKYELKGYIQGIKHAELIIGEYSADILVEEGEAELVVDPMEHDSRRLLKCGGEEQMLLSKYWKLSKKYELKKDSIVKLYQKALFKRDSVSANEYLDAIRRNSLSRQKKEDEIIRQHPNAYASAYITYYWRNGMSNNDLDARYALLGEKAKSSDLGMYLKKESDCRNAMQVGKLAPDFTLQTPEGEPFSLKDLKGKVKIIDFWASWCGPCRAENPNMVRLYCDYKKKGLEILSISIDEKKESWLAAIKADGMPWKHASDLKGWYSPITEAYVVNGVPHIVILDENNRIVAIDIRGEELREKIKEILDRE